MQQIFKRKTRIYILLECEINRDQRENCNSLEITISVRGPKQSQC